MAVPFWVVNLFRQREEAMEARWSSPLTQAQLANPWQRVVYDGAPLPGLWNLRKVKRKMVAQKKKKTGSDGGNANLRGLESAAFDLQGELYTPSHLDAWIKLVPSFNLVAPTGQTPPDARSSKQIEHPICTLSGVRFVVAVGIEYTAPQEGGPLRINIDLLGTDERKGATKDPKKKPVKTTSSADTPRIELNAAGQAKQNLRQYVLPPRPER